MHARQAGAAMGRRTPGVDTAAGVAAAAPGDPEPPWAIDAASVTGRLGVDPARGLTAAQVHRRRGIHGRNRLRERPPIPAWRILLEQFRSLVILLLVLAAAAAMVMGHPLEAGAIAIVIAVNTALGFTAERHAVRSMEALRSLAQSAVTVRRDGRSRRVHASDLVPGDIVLLEAGDIVSADLRILEASRLEADESALTGESLPVAKHADPAPATAPLAERASMLFSGTVIVLGSGAGVVTATGMATELGVIAHLASAAEGGDSPLERRLESLGRRLAGVAMILAGVAIAVGIAQGREPRLMVETGVALAVAAIPEGLPVVATLALARGMWRLARRHALIERLAAVETLGATGVILTDKTGTLTCNRMSVARIQVAGGAVEVRGTEEGGEAGGDALEAAADDRPPAAVIARFRRGDREIDPRADAEVRRAIETGLLCTNASLEREGRRWLRTGDPMELALLAVGHAAGIEPRAVHAAWPEVREEAFDPDTRMMATVHEPVVSADADAEPQATADSPADGGAGRFRIAVKGAPDAVIAACSRLRRGDASEPLEAAVAEAWTRRAEAMAAEGLRVLAVAESFAATADASPQRDLSLIGLLGLHDPPRPGVREAVGRCRDAGIEVVMVTGDQPGTALSIARAVGLAGDDGHGDGDGDGGMPRVWLGADVERLAAEDPEALRRGRVFARMEPAHKMRLLQLHQAGGAVVAMTGDGINDTPALRAADIGVAMGRRGTEAARQAADMVLQDDDFATIVVAVSQGRAIFANIRRAAIFMLSTNAAEIMAVAAAAMAGWPLPLRPMQILYLNLLTDALPALALAIGAATGGELRRPPRDSDEPILARRHWGRVLGGGAVIAVSVLAALLAAIHGLGLGETEAVTVSFLALALGKLGFAFTLRDPASPRIRNEITRNPWIWTSLVVCSLLLAAGVHLEWLAGVLRTASPGPAGWMLAVAAAAVPLLAGELMLTVRRERRRRAARRRAGREGPRSPRRCPAARG